MSDDKTSILIVDDLPEKIFVYQSVLEELGEQIITARSGAEALKHVLRTDFAVILLDVNMPDMDGFETARLIRQRKLSSHIPIIFLTAFADELRIAEGYATGGVDYLPTPVVPEILRAKVRVFVDLFRMRQQVARQAEEHAKRAIAEEAARRSDFLADASRIVASSLDITATLEGLARVVVPFLADFGHACILNGNNQFEGAASAWVSEGSERANPKISSAFGPLESVTEVICDAINRRRPHRIDEEFELNPLGEADNRLRYSHLLVLPLMTRGVPIGALLLAHGPSGRTFEGDDVALAKDLATRAGIALENALLVRDIQENNLRKDEFLAMLAHELRNPLAPVRSGLDLLAISGVEKGIVEPMKRQVSHLTRLVDDLLDVSRITRGTIELQPQVIDFRSVLNDAIETVRPLFEARKQHLHSTCPDSPLYVSGDPVRLTQVATNLLNNAVKFTPDAGAISLSVEQEANEVVFRVWDTGQGIAPEMLPRIFDLFVQANKSIERSQGGLGIGLTLVNRIVQMHRGSVQAFSDGLGMGSEFVVRLPVSVAPTSPQTRVNPSQSTPSTGTPLRIQVVDDNVDAATTLGMLLRLGGHTVQIAHEGRAGLAMIEETDPDVVLLDIGLPGLDGYEVARQIRASSTAQNVLLIAISGYGQDEDRRKAREAGFDHHLVKPIDFTSLSQLLPLGPHATRSADLEKSADRVG